MDYYTLNIGCLKRKLPIVSLKPNIKVASFNLLGDRELVETIAQNIFRKIKKIDFDYFVGPEVKVVPLLHELSKLFNKNRYIICRKNIHAYMVSPIRSRFKPELVLDGRDTQEIKGKKVIIVDDVVSSGKTFSALEELMRMAAAKIIYQIAMKASKITPAPIATLLVTSQIFDLSPSVDICVI